MVICNKCYNEHHDQCMGKAGMFDCGCICLRKPVEFNFSSFPKNNFKGLILIDTMQSITLQLSNFSSFPKNNSSVRNVILFTQIM